MGMSFEAVTEFLDSVERLYGVPACECIVCRDHRPIYRHAAGHMGWKGGEPVRGVEWYWIYSCTKIATMTAAMQLWERGLVGLDDPVSRYLPEYAAVTVRDGDGVRPAKTVMTLRHLMTMTGGFSYDQTLPSIQRAKEKNAGTRELIRMLAAEPLEFDPGTHFRYSMCHDVMAAVIEEVSGQRFSDYLREHIFAPLGVTGVAFRPGREQMERMPAQLCWHDRELYMFEVERDNTHQLTPAYDSGGAGICCRAEDYAVFLDALACGGTGANGAEILKPATVRQMTENQLTGQTLRDYHDTMKPSESEGYALGMRIHLGGDEFPAGEFGWDGAAGALAVMEPSRRLSVIYTQHVLNYLPNYAQLHPELMRRVYRCAG